MISHRRILVTTQMRLQHSKVWYRIASSSHRVQMQPLTSEISNCKCKCSRSSNRRYRECNRSFSHSPNSRQPVLTHVTSIWKTFKLRYRDTTQAPTKIRPWTKSAPGCRCGLLPIFVRCASCRRPPSTAAGLDRPPFDFWAFAPVAQSMFAIDAPGFFDLRGRRFQMAITTESSSRTDIYTKVRRCADFSPPARICRRPWTWSLLAYSILSMAHSTLPRRNRCDGTGSFVSSR